MNHDFDSSLQGQSEVHFVLDVQMTQMLQMNPMVQLEVRLMAEDLCKEGVPALTKVEFVESKMFSQAKAPHTFSCWGMAFVLEAGQIIVGFPMTWNKVIHVTSCVPVCVQ